jgi:hypothetical protein
MRAGRWLAGLRKRRAALQAGEKAQRASVVGERQRPVVAKKESGVEPNRCALEAARGREGDVCVPLTMRYPTHRHRGFMDPIREESPQKTPRAQLSARASPFKSPSKSASSRLLSQGHRSPEKPSPLKRSAATSSDPNAPLIEAAERLYELDAQLRSRTLLNPDEMRAEVKAVVSALERATASWEETPARPWEQVRVCHYRFSPN